MLALVGDALMTRYCRLCGGTPANFRVGWYAENAPLCESCADEIVACEHSFWSTYEVERDCGEVWFQYRCDRCGFIEW
jgi:hypothetical protein